VLQGRGGRVNSAMQAASPAGGRIGALLEPFSAAAFCFCCLSVSAVSTDPTVPAVGSYYGCTGSSGSVVSATGWTCSMRPRPATIDHRFTLHTHDPSPCWPIRPAAVSLAGEARSAARETLNAWKFCRLTVPTAVELGPISYLFPSSRFSAGFSEKSARSSVSCPGTNFQIKTTANFLAPR
jgi:hypothetical protein